jgi:cysteine sulfinate desulfinase/cysteine desulfurase-like protein
MGVEGDRLEGAIRVSFSHFNTQEEVAVAADKFAAAVLDLQSLR